MSESPDSAVSGIRRRTLLTSAAVGAAGLAGCLSRFRTVRNQEVPDQLSLDILTVPGDDDAVATQIARRLSNKLDTVGIDANLVLYDQDEFRREVLINQDYDLFVSAYPNIDSPDTLRPLLHSSFVREIGWQNPFEFTEINIDELLESQQAQTGAERRNTVDELQHEITRQQPLIPVAVPDTIRASRPDRFIGWDSVSPGLSQSLVQIDQVNTETDTLRLVSTDGRVTKNLNPIAIEYRNRGEITGLLYDSLGREYGGEIQPWAAAEWELSETGNETVATVTLHSNLEFHDGTPLTASDVVFTYEFLQDTSLDEFDVPVPAPRFRGRTSLIDEITAIDEETLEIRFSETRSDNTIRAFTVPIFPKSEWEEKAQAADIAGVELSESVTEALVWENAEPMGSGPFRFESSTENEQLVLRRNENHVLNQGSASQSAALAEQFPDGIPFERLVLRIVRSDSAAVGLLTSGDVDAVISDLNPGVVPNIGREPDIDLHVQQSRTLYLIGCNTVREPLGNPHFRRLIARLIDKDGIRSEVFSSFARPAASPLTGTEWLSSGLRWEEEDPELPFFGTDGNLDVDAIRDHLREIGFEFSNGGELLEQ